MRLTGRDRPGITARLLGVIATAGVELLDADQVVIRGRLTLDLLLGAGEDDAILKDLLFVGRELDLEVDFEAIEGEPSDLRAPTERAVVTVIGRVLEPAALAAVTSAIAASGANIDRIVRLARTPVLAYEFVTHGGDVAGMRAALVEASQDHEVDVAVQREGLARRAKRLVVIDVDSTLIQDEVIELLATEVGCGDEVADITRRAMAGELDFEASLRERVSRLAGASVDVVDRVAARVRLTPGARTFVRTLHRLGYAVAIVSGGFTRVIEPLAAELGITHAAANELEVVDGHLTGRIVGPIVDRAEKAAVLRRVAEAEHVPLEQTVAIGDGANDLDMIAAAGLGIAFNAKPVVRAAADTSVTVPYLDAILFLLGIARDDVEAADAADPGLTALAGGAGRVAS